MKTCSCCGKVSKWSNLKSIGEVRDTVDGVTYVLDLRNCDCGSTLAVEVAP